MDGGKGKKGEIGGGKRYGGDIERDGRGGMEEIGEGEREIRTLN